MTSRGRGRSMMRRLSIDEFHDWVGKVLAADYDDECGDCVEITWRDHHNGFEDVHVRIARRGCAYWEQWEAEKARAARED